MVLKPIGKLSCPLFVVIRGVEPKKDHLFYESLRQTSSFHGQAATAKSTDENYSDEDQLESHWLLVESYSAEHEPALSDGSQHYPR